MCKDTLFSLILGQIAKASQSRLFLTRLSTHAQYERKHTVFMKLNYICQKIQYGHISPKLGKNTLFSLNFGKVAKTTQKDCFRQPKEEKRYFHSNCPMFTKQAKTDSF